MPESAYHRIHLNLKKQINKLGRYRINKHVAQNLTSEFCYFLKIINEQQNIHAKLIIHVVMQSADDAGNISWSSLISVTSLFPETRPLRVSGPLTTTVSAQNHMGFVLLCGRRGKKKS